MGTLKTVLKILHFPRTDQNDWLLRPASMVEDIPSGTRNGPSFNVHGVVAILAEDKTGW